MPSSPEKLLDRLMRGLERDQMYVERFPIWDRRRIKHLRETGRQAGRRLGRKVRTFARPSFDGLEMVVIIVLVDVDDEPEAHLRSRSDQLIRNALNDDERRRPGT